MVDDDLTADERRAAVAELQHWRHRIDVGRGVVTNGWEDMRPEARRLGFPADLTGKRVLDVGCSDGWFSFAAEEAGASEVIGIDDLSSHLNERRNGFEIAAELRNSKARFEECDAMDLDPARFGTFDLVLLINVLYHLPHPLMALMRIAEVTAPGGTLLLKTLFRSDVRLWLRGRAFQFDIGRTPKLWLYPNNELADDPTNWCAPNRAGVEALLEMAGFAPTLLAVHGDRCYYSAVRNAG